jgi:hypothetical protein
MIINREILQPNMQINKDLQKRILHEKPEN